MEKKDLLDIEVPKDGLRSDSGAYIWGGQSWCLFCGKKYVSAKLIEMIKDTQKCPNCGQKLVPQR